ncbi:uncharacterized protein LOC130665052 [Microplitis mediator]|uniref:uncharacterized protein LOC130665052 n=1 Tax=Microplitis mediator TaxID=375433 RepID=UPI00255441C9|nr:uncharacterized protein LOC130665052 [Microplitis mediator]
MWPVYLSINELPFVERTKRENLLIIGLWFGQQKPNANNYFHKFYHQLKKLSTGINITLANDQIIKIKAVLLIGTCDLPAKCRFLNFTYYNGTYDCPSCLWPGETYRLTDDGSSHTHVYPYTPDPEMRTSGACLIFAEVALNNDSPHMGVKGPCALSKLMPNFIAGTAIDQMHCIFGGVVKKLLSLWIDVSNRNEPYSLVDTSEIINSRLIAIKPPSFVHRMPRTIDDLVHWKASELKNWFFYYSISVMTGIMQPEYLEHFSLLVAGISILNFDSITDANVNMTSNLLNKFVREFELKYGLKNCSINIHLILHLPQSVLTLGPLWANDCFGYEDLNGQYLNAINGTRHIDSQIIRSHNQQLKLHRFFDQLPEGKIKDFCFKRKQNSKICEQLQEGCYTIGTYKTYDDNYEIPNYVEQAVEHLLPARKIEGYSRLLKNSKLYVSEQYTRAIQTTSSYILYRDHTGYHLGSILCFIKFNYCQCRNRHNCLNHRVSVHQAVIQSLSSKRVFKTEDDHNVQYEISYLYKCLRMNNFVSISIDQLISVCFEIKIENDLYIAIPVNSNNNE